jgi:hypothetical protein
VPAWVSFTLAFAVLSLQGVDIMFIFIQYWILLVIAEQIWAGHCCCCLTHCKNALLNHHEFIINPSVVHQKGRFSCTSIVCVACRNVIRCRMTFPPVKQVYLMMFLLEVYRCWMIHKLNMESSSSVWIVSLKASRWDIFYHASLHTTLLQPRRGTATLLLNATLNATVAKVIHFCIIL